MVRARRGFVVWPLLAGYLFAVTAATSFHEHGKTAWLDRTASQHACDGYRHADLEGWHGQDGTDFGARVAVERGGDPFACSSEHSCAVCQFLSQKVLPARPLGATCCEPLRELTVSCSPAQVA